MADLFCGRGYVVNWQAVAAVGTWIALTVALSLSFLQRYFTRKDRKNQERLIAAIYAADAYVPLHELHMQTERAVDVLREPARYQEQFGVNGVLDMLTLKAAAKLPTGYKLHELGEEVGRRIALLSNRVLTHNSIVSDLAETSTIHGREIGIHGNDLARVADHLDMVHGALLVVMQSIGNVDPFLRDRWKQDRIDVPSGHDDPKKPRRISELPRL